MTHSRVSLDDVKRARTYKLTAHTADELDKINATLEDLYTWVERAEFSAQCANAYLEANVTEYGHFGFEYAPEGYNYEPLRDIIAWGDVTPITVPSKGSPDYNGNEQYPLSVWNTHIRKCKRFVKKINNAVQIAEDSKTS